MCLLRGRGRRLIQLVFGRGTWGRGHNQARLERLRQGSVAPGLKMSSLIRRHLGHGRPSVAKSSKPSKPFLPTSHSPQEGYLKECEDRLSTEELRGNVVDYLKRNEDYIEQCQDFQLDLANGRDAQREALFQHFYQTLQKTWDREKPSDCVIVSMDTNQRDYATAIGRRLQDRGLVVETIHLVSESDLTRALQDVKDDGSPFCILVEQSNVKYSSCTVIMLHDSIKIHRHMPLEDALVLVTKELKRFFTGQSAGISQRATELVDDFLARERLASYSVPSSICHLLFLLREGKHLYSDELGLIMDYLTVRKEQLQGFETRDPSASSMPPSFQGQITPTVSKPPPLLPVSGPRPLLDIPLPRCSIKPLVGDRQEVGLLPAPGLVNPKGLFPPPLLQVGPSKRPAPPGCPSAMPVKRPLPRKKQLPVLLKSVPPKWALQPMSLQN
ncbi:nuclear receptor coactivator 5-like isoform X2 [Mesocricetus auratus]|uniref:Nuclear receptor coactivator 5-like isoform X2 n=1 Tax=Mesocricetus auratus TaxID=10036 RepID=A0ABM2WS37_MESAU|nr:nuclear receptor coactivator 5-like isoform X2 [Mesocricetus auratus]